MIDKLVKIFFEIIKELTHIKQTIIYCFKNHTADKNFNDFGNGIELFRKIQSGKMKLEDVKELRKLFK